MSKEELNTIILQYFDITAIKPINKKHTQRFMLTHLKEDERKMTLKPYSVVCEWCGETHSSTETENWKYDRERKKWYGKCGCGKKVTKRKNKVKVYDK